MWDFIFWSSRGHRASALRQLSLAALLALAATSAALPDDSPVRDVYGDPLPAGALVRLGTGRYRGLIGPAFLADDRTLVAIGRIQSVLISAEGAQFSELVGDRLVVINASTGEQIREITTGALRIARLQLDSDRHAALTFGYEYDDDRKRHQASVTRWDFTTGEPIAMTSLGSQPQGSQFEVTPDGKQIVTGVGGIRGGTLRVLNVDTGEVVNSLAAGLQFTAAAVSPDSKTIIASSIRPTSEGMKGSLYFWEWASDQEAVRLEIDRPAGALAFSSDGSRLAVGPMNGDEIVLFDVATRKSIRTLPKEDQGPIRVNALNFLSDGRLLADNHVGMATTGVDLQVHLWDLRTGKIQRAIDTGRNKRFERSAISGDGKFLAVSNGTMIKVWDLDTGTPFGKDLIGHEVAISRIKFSHDGRSLITGGMDGTAGSWNAATGKLRHFQSAGKSVSAISGEHGLIAAASEGEIHVLDTVLGKALCRVPGYAPEAMWTAAFNTEGKHLATWGDDYQLRIWDIATGKPVAERRVPDIDPPPQRALGAGGGGGARAGAFGAAAERITRAVFSSDGRRLACAWFPSAAIQIFDVESGLQLTRLAGEEGSLVAMEFSPDGLQIATSRRGRRPVAGMAFRRGAPAVALAGPPAIESTVSIYEIDSGKTLLQVELPEYGAGPVAFSPDGKTLAVVAGELNARIELFTIASGQLHGTIESLPAAAACLCFSADLKRLASGLTDGTALVWDVKLPP